VQRAAAELEAAPSPVPAETIKRLQDYHWPGNVRELANAVERAVILSNGAPLTPDLFDGLVTAVGSPARDDSSSDVGHRANGSAISVETTFDLGEIERMAIKRALQETGGNRTQAARLLGISERTLRSKLNTKGVLNKA